MKYLLLPALLMMFACQSKQTPQEQALSEEERQIAQDLIQGVFDDVWAAADTTKLDQYHTPDFIILEQGDIWDNDRIRQYCKSVLQRENRATRINKMDYISIEKYGESMQIAYFNEADFLRGDSIVHTAGWLESALAVKTEKGWRLKMMHSTRTKNK